MSKKTASLSRFVQGDTLEVDIKGNKLHGSFINFDESDGILVLKLKSGYDVALSKKEVNSISLLEHNEVKKQPETATKKPEQDFDIELIATGGTIASKIDYRTGGTSPSFSGDHYIELAPEMSKYGRINVKVLMNIWSENMLPSDWVKIAKEAYSAINKGGAKGVIVTMGTDAMHFAASALSFLLNPLSVPVVITGAQRSSDRGSSDASSNLLLSSIVASKWSGGESVVCMHATVNDDYNFILRGNRVRKMHTERRDAFRPINTPPLGKVFLDGKIEDIGEHITKSDKTAIDTKLDANVKLLASYPGMGGEAIKYYLGRKVHGLVIAGTGFGNLPIADKSLMSALKEANKKEVPIVITSQTVYGSTNKFVYSALRELSSLENIIYVNDMLTETAFTKLMFVLGHTRDIKRIKETMQTPLAGELSTRSAITDYLI